MSPTQPSPSGSETPSAGGTGTTDTTIPATATPAPTSSTTTAAPPAGGGDGSVSVPCSGGHTWQAITDTVEHAEVGHYVQTVTGYTDVTVYQCSVCSEWFESLDAYYTHFDGEEMAVSDALVAVFRERYATDTKRKPIYGQKWVVDEPAYTETVTVGYRCRVCGKQRDE